MFYIYIEHLFLNFIYIPNIIDILIEKVAPIPNQIVIVILIKKKIIAIGRRSGFWNLFNLSIIGIISKPIGTINIKVTPNSLLGIVRRSWNVGKKYHSGRISSGVAKGFASFPIEIGSSTDKLITQINVLKITIGKIYRRSFGHAGSP